MGGPVFRAISRAPPLVEQIYGMLRNQLRSGAFQAGERLVDSSLATALAVSRTPVREALSRLVADGLLETGDSGFQIPVLTVAVMEEIFDVRGLIEPPAAQRAARAMDAVAIAGLERAVEAAREAEAAGDQADFLEANYLFRSIWVARVRNPRLQEALLRFDDQAGPVRRATLALPSARKDALRLLGQGLEAFRNADAEAAGRYALTFIEAAARYFREIAAANPAYRSPAGSIIFGEHT